MLTAFRGGLQSWLGARVLTRVFLSPKAAMAEPLIPWSPVPGGCFAANTQMLRDNGAMDRRPGIIASLGAGPPQRLWMALVQ